MFVNKNIEILICSEVKVLKVCKGFKILQGKEFVFSFETSD